MDAEPEQFHVVFAVEPACRLIVVLGGDLGDQAYLMRSGACSAVAPRHGQSPPMFCHVPTDRFAMPTGFCSVSVPGLAPDRTLQTERTEPPSGPVGEASSTQSDAREGEDGEHKRRMAAVH